MEVNRSMPYTRQAKAVNSMGLQTSMGDRISNLKSMLKVGFASKNASISKAADYTATHKDTAHTHERRPVQGVKCPRAHTSLDATPQPKNPNLTQAKAEAEPAPSAQELSCNSLEHHPARWQNAFCRFYEANESSRMEVLA